MTSLELKDKFEIYRKGFVNDFPVLYKNWITDLDEYIANVSIATPETYLDHIVLANQGLRAITWAGNPLANNLELTHYNMTAIIAWSSEGLLQISDTNDWTLLNKHVEQFGSLALYYGYLAIFLLNTIRLDYDLESKKTKDQILIKYSDAILRDIYSEEEKKNNTKLILEAQENINSFSMNIFNKNCLPMINNKLKTQKKIECKSITDPDEFTCNTTSEVKKAVPDDISDALLEAATGSDNIAYCAKRAAEKYEDGFRKNEILNRESIVSLDGNITEDSECSRMEWVEDISTPDPERAILTQEKREYETKILNLAKQFISDPSKLTNKQREVLKMRYSEERFVTLEEVGNKLNKRKQTVHENEQLAIKKIRKFLGLKSD